MNVIKKICVFCGAQNNVSQKYFDEGRAFGQEIAKKELTLVYGGAKCGVMGAVANGCLENGGKVIGVFPKVLEDIEAVHSGITEIHVVEDMHTRKSLMYELSDMFVTFPGGFGTLDETFEIITWKQLHNHNKPIYIYNYDGYWNDLVSMTENILQKGFAQPITAEMYDVVSDMKKILENV